MDRLLYLLETNPRLTNSELAVMLGVSENEVKEQIRIYEESGVIKGYRAIIDKDKVNACCFNNYKLYSQKIQRAGHQLCRTDKR